MIRGIGLRGAVAVNVITMIGIGPLITIPLVLSNLPGELALAGWLVGALIALCDGLVWAELGALYPGSGGTYVFLRETFGRDKAGRLLAFLFAWQTVLSAPLVLASGYIGFAHYAGYLWPALAKDARLQGVVAAAVGLVTLFALYRPITRVAALGLALAGIATATLGATILATLPHFDAARAGALPHHAALGGVLLAGLGPTLVITLYDYYGYGSACTVSDEVRAPARVLPLSIVVSIALVGALYVLLQIGILGVVPWQQLVAATPGGSPPDAAAYVASLAIERTWGVLAARVVTVAILLTAFASVFGNLLGISRVPYAAAVDGAFLSPFARLHRTGRFPHVSLVTIGLLALPACFLSLGDVINALTAGLVVIQNLAQIAAVIALRKRGIASPYRMWWFPLPVVVAGAGWAYVFFSAGAGAIAFGLATLAAGTAVYVWRAKVARTWPFAAAAATLAAFVAVGLGAASARTAVVPDPAAAAHSAVAAQPVRARWGASAFATLQGHTVFTVRGNPFFVYGAAFFYERLPRDAWPASMRELKALGFNTLDLYVPWNWHELADGDFDFTGRTSPRRDLEAVLRLARRYDFELIVRPGPVIRNEWRNGGYPAWLLQRPEYAMPEHDLLEGRYPPIATLQNAHSDDAAAAWLANGTHLRYARRWLSRALREFVPVSDRVLAVALDDDQGAYIDNQTWPAPHLRSYLQWLERVVHAATAPSEPVFINTYQMKVTASSPVWAMGNWYQSDAYAIGDHDREQLAFSTALLGTRPRQPVMLSEFQAGWLQQPGDIRPRPADPANTLLAFGTMLGAGARGVVCFPAQDTLYPAGWEAPFANAFYAWDAGLRLDSSHAPRYTPLRRFGDIVRRYGSELAASTPVYDAAIVYTPSMFPAASLTSEDFLDIAGRTIDAQRACERLGLSCSLVDLRYADAEALQQYPVLLVPVPSEAEALEPQANALQKLSRYKRAGGVVVAFPRWPWRRTIAGKAGAGIASGGIASGASVGASLTLGLRSAHRAQAVSGLPGATFARSLLHPRAGFLTYANYGEGAVDRAQVRVHLDGGNPIAVLRIRVPGRSIAFVPIGIATPTAPLPEVHPQVRSLDRAAKTLPAGTPTFRTAVAHAGTRIAIRDDAFLDVPAFRPVPAGRALAYTADVYGDGSQAIVLENDRVRIVVAPQAGARAFVFEDTATGRNAFTSIGSLRDDVAIEPPLSTSDRIAKYTHQFPAGTFNRPYKYEILESGARAVARFTYDALDVLPAGARFTRTLTLGPASRTLAVDEQAEFHGAQSGEIGQRAVSVSSLAVGSSASGGASQRLLRADGGSALGYYDILTHELVTLAWHAGDVEPHVEQRGASIVARLTLSTTGVAHTEYGYVSQPTLAAAQAAVQAADLAAQGPAAASANTNSDAGKWRNGLRDRLKSD